jgi:hypothetical protein
MPDEPIPEVTFAAGNVWMEVLGGVGLLLCGLLSLPGHGYPYGILGVFGVCFLWRSVRSWRKPYIALNRDRLVVLDHGRPTHYVPCAAIAAVEPALNSTRLRMRDGLKISISHDRFVSRANIERFRYELGKQVNLDTAQATVP